MQLFKALQPVRVLSFDLDDTLYDNKPVIAAADIFILQGTISDDDFLKIKKYLINPVDSREASLKKTETLDSLINQEVDKVLTLDSLIDKEHQKVIKLDSLIQKSSTKLDSVVNKITKPLSK